MKALSRIAARSALVALLPLAACDSGAAVEPEPTIGFAAEVAPIFAGRCNICHYPQSAIKFDLSNPFDPATGIVSRENSWASQGADESLVVDPGNPENSSLIVKVRDSDLDDHVDGNPMPYHLPRLSEVELGKVETWILDGANNDAFFASEVAPIFGTEITLRSTAGRCTYCHYPDSPTGMDVLNVFDADEGMVNVESAAGGLIVSPGNPAQSVLLTRLRGDTAGPQMPMHYPRLGAAEVEVIELWIRQGAKNN